MKQFESGRGMVEMLGVLAVMGIVSVTGVNGYQSAIKKHRANELIHEAAGRALAVSQQVDLGVMRATAIRALAMLVLTPLKTNAISVVTYASMMAIIV